MKYSALFLAITIACALSVKTGSQTHMSLQSSMHKLQQSAWGQVAASFLDLQMTVGSPIGDLIQAFQDFLRDNNFKMEVNQKDYEIQLAEHNAWEAAIRERISNAENGIATATSTLDNVLYPLRGLLKKQIERDNALDEQTVKDMHSAECERRENVHNHDLFVEECEAAIDAINDCLELLEDLKSGATSLVQVTKVQRSFKKISASLKNTRHASIVKALLKLADFANPEMLGKLVAKFIAVRDALVADIEHCKQEELDSIANFDMFMLVSEETLSECRARVSENTGKAEENDQSVSGMIEFHASSAADLDVADEDLAFEINRWHGVQHLFDKMFAELKNERDAINEVIEICMSIDVSAETLERMNQ